MTSSHAIIFGTNSQHKQLCVSGRTTNTSEGTTFLNHLATCRMWVGVRMYLHSPWRQINLSRMHNFPQEIVLCQSYTILLTTQGSVVIR